MNQITDVLRDSKRLRLIATALELLQYEKIDSAVIPIPGTEPQRYVVVGTAETVARLLEIAPAAREVTQQADAFEVEGIKPTGDDLYDAGNFLLNAAQQFWDSCHQAGQYGAVQWLTGSNGELLIYTRGEYRDQLMTNIHTFPSQKEKQFPVTQQAAPEALQSCSEAEVAAFEAWASGEKYDMATHPLHWLFLDARTYAARQGWKAALRFTVTQQAAKAETGSVAEEYVSKLRSTLYAIANTLDDGELRHAAKEAYDIAPTTSTVSAPEEVRNWKYMRANHAGALADALGCRTSDIELQLALRTTFGKGDAA